MQKKEKSFLIIGVVIMSCIIMAIIETVIEPSYFIKSALKVLFFFIIPLVSMKLLKASPLNNFFLLNSKSIIKLLGLGGGIYAIIIVAFLLTRHIFDYTTLINSLSADQNVSPKSFIWVASYISFGNSLLEEFMFRLYAFILLSECISKKAAYAFSSLMFAIYHVAMFGSAFPLPLIIISLIGLAVGGMIFNYVNDKNRTIYNSWVIHMFADFAIMSIWYIHI